MTPAQILDMAAEIVTSSNEPVDVPVVPVIRGADMAEAMRLAEFDGLHVGFDTDPVYPVDVVEAIHLAGCGGHHPAGVGSCSSPGVHAAAWLFLVAADDRRARVASDCLRAGGKLAGTGSGGG